MDEFHKPVLLKEVIEFLNLQKDKKYIDATLGGGGDTFEILKRGGVLLGIDFDPEALEFVKRKWKIEARNWNIKEENLTLVKGNFREIGKIAKDIGFEKVSGIIFDLGVSSRHLDKAERGFSFQKSGPLDMRMDPSIRVTAKDLVNGLSKKELYELFTKLGQERRALAISDRIVRARRIKPIETTRELAEIVEKTYGIKEEARIFQALRIAVNDEINNLKRALPEVVSLLEKNGRIIVISFHSLEDRVVKDAFREFQQKGLGEIITKKPVEPSITEKKENRRSRSAKLRVFERT